MLNHECIKDGKIGNVIFLDIDGVINSMRSMKFGELYDMDCVRNVRRILKHCNCDIVVSSSWRIGLSTKVLREMLFPLGLCTIIGKTATNVQGGTSLTERGDEINAWIDKFGCTNYVILDDDSDMTEFQKENHFVRTDPYTGITEKESTFAIRNIFKVTTPFCPECNGYGRVNQYDKCPSCNGKIISK